VSAHLPRRILLVEDDPDSRSELRLLLEDEGFEVVEARDGQSALAMAGQTPPDAVVQDLILPDIPGFELLRALRRTLGGRAVPVVALSAFTERLEEARRSDIGFCACLRKPADLARLPAVLHRVIG
jgi:DNA-binding response OmpR family regulator